jgi:FlaA1/EpsC-like NDP-sugar epimerase
MGLLSNKHLDIHQHREAADMIEKRVIITGATGMVGGCALRICLENPRRRRQGMNR